MFACFSRKLQRVFSLEKGRMSQQIECCFSTEITREIREANKVAEENNRLRLVAFFLDNSFMFLLLCALFTTKQSMDRASFLTNNILVTI